MRVEVSINGADVKLFERSLSLNSRLGKRISTASFDVEGEERWATPSFAIAEANAIGGYTRPWVKDEVKIDRGAAPFVNCAIAEASALGGNSTYTDHFFGGYLAAVELKLAGVRRFYRCTAQDYNVLPTTKLVTKTYSAKTEQEIIDDLFTAYLPNIDTSTYVESSGTTYTLKWTRAKLSEALDELAKINSKEWYIDHEKYLHYFTPVTTAAPFGFSDTPSLSTLLPYSALTHVEDATKLIKTITVVGDTSVPVVVTRTKGDTDDADYEDKVVDNNINTNAWAELVGDAIIAEHGSTKVRGRLTCEQEGLVVGQKVKVKNPMRGIDDYYLVQGLRLSIIGSLTEQVDVEYGDYRPRLSDLLGRIKILENKEK